MQKNPDTKRPAIEEEPRRKSGKRKRRETVCADKKRDYFNCGICGSGDIAQESIYCCEVCGAETFTIEQGVWWPWERPSIRICDCKYLRHGSFVRSTLRHLSVAICLTCGSVKGNTCPSCKNRRFFSTCWTSPFGEKRCSCGYCQKGYKVEG